MTKLFRKLKKDNSGAALVLVLMVATLISMLVAVILLVMVTNTKMKTTESAGETNFREVDSAIEVLTIGLENYANDAMKEAYSHMLLLYTQTVQSKRLEKLQKKFQELMISKLTEGLPNPKPVGMPENAINITELEALIQAASNNGVVLDGNNGGIVPTWVKNNDYSVTIKDIRLTYVDDQGYETIITTDIVFSVPSSLVDISHVSDDINYWDYSVICDGSLKKENDISTIANIYGNVYAGTSIVSDYAKLYLYGNLNVSRGNLIAKNSGYVQLSNAEGVSKELWVKGVSTEGVSKEGTAQTWIKLFGTSFVSDDLSLNANYGSVEVPGVYYGYQTANAKDPASSSSAIVVNAKHAELKLDGTISVAGKSFVATPNFYSALTHAGVETAIESLSDTDKEKILLTYKNPTYKTLLQGESVTFQGTQNAYLVPGDCIVGFYHNPLTAAEYQQLLDSVATTDVNNALYRKYYVDLSRNAKKGGLNLNYYANVSSPYTAVDVWYIGSNNQLTKSVYLYLNFASPSRASDYFTSYFNTYNNSTTTNRLNNIASSLGLGAISTTGSINATGNVISYNPAGGLANTPSSNPNDSNFTKQEMTSAREYSGLITYLDKDYPMNDTSKTLCNTILHFASTSKAYDGDYIQQHTSGHILLEGYDKWKFEQNGMHRATRDETDAHPFVLITNQNVTIAKDDSNVITVQNGSDTPVKIPSFFEGLIISGQNVIVNDVEFNGMIIALGDVQLIGGATLKDEDFQGTYTYDIQDEENPRVIHTYEMKNVDDLIKHDQRIYKWFTTYKPSGAENSTGFESVGVNISFENWKKNN